MSQDQERLIKDRPKVKHALTSDGGIARSSVDMTSNPNQLRDSNMTAHFQTALTTIDPKTDKEEIVKPYRNRKRC